MYPHLINILITEILYFPNIIKIHIYYQTIAVMVLLNLFVQECVAENKNNDRIDVKLAMSVSGIGRAHRIDVVGFGLIGSRRSSWDYATREGLLRLQLCLFCLPQI